MSHLDYYIHDGLEALRLEIRGPLSGHGVTSLDHAWRTGSSILIGRTLLFDLVSVEETDEDGRDLLLAWHRMGARIMARSTESRLLAEGILGVRVAMPAATPGWRQRLKLFLRGSAAVARGLA